MIIDMHSHTYHTVEEAYEGSITQQNSWHGFDAISGEERDPGSGRQWRMLDGTPKSQYFAKGISVSRIVQEMDEAAIDKTCILHGNLSRVYGGTGDGKLAELYLRSYPDRFLAFIGVDPIRVDGGFNSGGIQRVRRAIEEDGYSGFKMMPTFLRHHAEAAVNYPYYALAIELDVPITIHQGLSQLSSPPAEFARPYHLDQILIDFPELRMNVAHFGWPWEEEVFALMVKHQNLYTDLSMISDFGIARLARDLATARDYQVIDRVLFGTDAGGRPPKLLVEWVSDGVNQFLERTGVEPLTHDEIAGVLGGNAVRFLKLTKSGA